MSQFDCWIARFQAFFVFLFVIGLTFSISLWQYSLLGGLFVTIIRMVREPAQRRLIESGKVLLSIISLYVLWTLIAAFATQQDKNIFAGVSEEWLFLAIPVVWSAFSGLNGNYRKWLFATLGATIVVITFSSFLSQFIGYNVLRPSDLDSLKLGRCSGAFSHPLTYAEVMLGLSMLMIAFAMFEESAKSRRFYWISFSCASLGVVSSGSRVVTVILLGVTLIIILLRWKMLKPLTRAVCLIPLIALGLTLGLNPKSMQRESTFPDEEVQIQQYGKRTFVWQTSWEIALDHPLFGVGPDGFAKEYDRRLPPDVLKPLHFTHAHNDALNMTATRGFIGGLLYLALLAAILHRFWKQWKVEHMLKTELHTLRFGAGIGILALCACGITESTLVDEEVRGVLMLLVGFLFVPSMKDDQSLVQANSGKLNHEEN